MKNIGARCICIVIGHLQVKEMIYTTTRCSLCKKICLLRTCKMVKCIGKADMYD
jgi:hypothetical protein